MINFSAVRPETIVGKLVRIPFRLLPTGMAMPVLQGPLAGKKWIVGSYTHGCWLGSYEPDMQRSVAKEVRRGGVFYDLGANVGFYSLMAAVLSDPGKVYAFEPLPANLDYLRRHIELNRIRNIEVLPLAVSDKEGSALFKSGEYRELGRLETDGNLRVQVTTLDALLQRKTIAPPDCIKMDVEGEELCALRGAKECFTKHRPRLFLCTHSQELHSECCRLLSSWGYKYQQIRQITENAAELFASPITS